MDQLIAHFAANRPPLGAEQCSCCGGQGEHQDGSECRRCEGLGHVPRGSRDPHCPDQPQPRRRHWRQPKTAGIIYSHTEDEPGKHTFDAHDEETGRNAGYATVEEGGPRHAFIDEVYVHPDYRRSGIARQLMGNALGHFPGREVNLRPAPYEKPDATRRGPGESQLRGFYRSFGFEDDPDLPDTMVRRQASLRTAVRWHHEIPGGTEGLRWHLCQVHGEHRDEGTPEHELDETHEDEHDGYADHDYRRSHSCPDYEHDEHNQPTEWDEPDLYSSVEGIHRGIGVNLPDDLHRFVHDRRRSKERRAQALLDHVRDHPQSETGGLGVHWTSNSSVAEDFAEKRASYLGGHEAPKGRGSTAVVLHAHMPDREDIGDAGYGGQHGDVYGYTEHGEREVPLRPGGGVHVTGISWQKRHGDDRDWDAQYEHHDFAEPGHHEASRRPDLLGHFGALEYQTIHLPPGPGATDQGGQPRSSVPYHQVAGIHPGKLVSIYRAVPEHAGSINQGDWVSLHGDWTRERAESAPGLKVLYARVPARHVYLDASERDDDEAGYHGPPVAHTAGLLEHFEAATNWGHYYDKIPGEIHRGLYAPESHGVFGMPMSDEDVAHGLIAAHQEEHFPYRQDRHLLFGTHWSSDEDVARGFAHEHQREHFADHGEDDGHDHDEHFEATPVVFHAQRPHPHEIENDPRRLGWQNVDDYDHPEQEVPIKHGAPVRITGVSWLKHTGLGPIWHRHDLREPVELRAEDRDSPSEPDEWNDDEHHGQIHTAAAGLLDHFEAMADVGDYGGGHRPYSGADRFHDLGNQTFPDDVYDHPEHYSFGDYGNEHVRQMHQARGNPDKPVSIYRAMPAKASGTINPGDWISTSRQYAKGHAEMRNPIGRIRYPEDHQPQEYYHVYHAKVPAKHVYSGGSDLLEWGYDGPPVQGEHIKGCRHAVHAARQREGDTRLYSTPDTDYEMRYHTEDQGERRPRHVIETRHPDGSVAGRLAWYGTTGTIHRIEVAGPEDTGEHGLGNGQDHRRKGIATAMWDWGQEMTPRPRHSGDKTDQGKQWAKSVGGPGWRKGAAGPDAPYVLYHGAHHDDVPGILASGLERRGDQATVTTSREGASLYGHLRDWTAPKVVEIHVPRSQAAQYLGEGREGVSGEGTVHALKDTLPPVFIRAVHEAAAQHPDELPPDPGTQPIPEGHIRLWHYTPLHNVPSIREHGLQRQFARGDSGTGDLSEPSAGVWASTKRPDDILNNHEGGFGVVEYHAHPGELSPNAETPWHSDPQEWAKGYHHVIMQGDVHPRSIVAIHEPWHGAARYMRDDDSSLKSYQWVKDEYAKGPHNAHLEPYVRALNTLERGHRKQAVAEDYGPREQWDSERYKSEGRDYANQYRDREDEWKRRINRGVALGDLHPDEAKKLGWFPSGHANENEGRGWQKLPHELYHVTTDLGAVRASGGLKTRDELRQMSGHGLGGGENDTISFTTNRELAGHILNSLHEFHHFLNHGHPQELWDKAQRGEGAQRPFHAGIAHMYGDYEWKHGDPLPKGLDDALAERNRHGGINVGTRAEMERDHGPGWEPADEGWDTPKGRVHAGPWTRPMNADEKLQNKAYMYKQFSAARDYAGGPPDPMFFQSDTKAFAAKDPHQFAIIHARPKPGARGYPLSGMHEWRTTTGDAVEAHRAERLGEDRRLHEASLRREAAEHESWDPYEENWDEYQERINPHVAPSETEEYWNPRHLYHGTSAELQPGDLAEEGHPGNFPGKGLQHAYATPHISTAAGYGETSAYNHGGRPRVYEVARAHDMMPDPETGAAFGISSESYEHPDWRSRAGFRVIRELHPDEFRHHLTEDWPGLGSRTARLHEASLRRQAQDEDDGGIYDTCYHCQREHNPHEHASEGDFNPDWDSILARTPSVHRVVGLALPEHEHAAVHDPRTSPEHAAGIIARHLASPELGHMHWAAPEGLEYAQASYGHSAAGLMGPRVTSVMLHARTPRPEHIHQDADDLIEAQISPYRHPEYEIPLAPAAPVHVTGMSWRPAPGGAWQGSRWKSGLEAEWRHHTFARPLRIEAVSDEPRIPLYDKRPSHDEAHALVHRRIDKSDIRYKKEGYGLGPDDKLADNFDLVPVVNDTESMATGRPYRTLQWGVRVNGQGAGYIESNFEGTRHKLLPYGWGSKKAYDPEVHGEPQRSGPRRPRYSGREGARKPRPPKPMDLDEVKRRINALPEHVDTGPYEENAHEMGHREEADDDGLAFWTEVLNQAHADLDTKRHEGALRHEPALQNPKTGAEEWYHGSGAHHEELHQGFHDPAEMDAGAYSMPEGQYDSPGHWNALLGTHFTAHHALAREFAHGEHSSGEEELEPYADEDRERKGSLVHARLAIRNPKVYGSEHEMDHEAYEHEFRAGNHPISHLPDVMYENDEGREDMWPDAMRIHRDFGTSEIPSGIYGHSGTAFDKHPMRTAWLNTHPDKHNIAQRFKQRLMEAGHDGIVYRNEYEKSAGGGAGNTCAVAFHPHQIDITQTHGADQPCDSPEEGDLRQRRLPGRGQQELPFHEAGQRGDLPDLEYWHIKQGREKGGYHAVAAAHNGMIIGHVTWGPGDDRVRQLWVHPQYRRRGIADAIYARAKWVEPGLGHHPDRTPAGDAWAHAVDGEVPERLNDTTSEDADRKGQWTADQFQERLDSGHPTMKRLAAGESRLPTFATPEEFHAKYLPMDKTRLDALKAEADQLGRISAGMAENDPESLLARKKAYDAQGRYQKAVDKSVARARANGTWPRIAAWIPHARIFGPTHCLDHRLFDGDQLKPAVREAVMERLDQALRVDTQLVGSEWQDWITVYLAGSEASMWTSENCEGNGDFDTLLDIDYSEARRHSARNSGFATMDEDQIQSAFNAALRTSYNSSQWHPPFDPQGTWDLTGYVNRRPLAEIKPYAAWDITHMRWLVKPPELPDWGPERFPQGPAVFQEGRGLGAMVRAVLRLPEPFRTQEASRIWDWIHEGRARDFSQEGLGWQGTGNVLEKMLDQMPGHLVDKLKQLRYNHQEGTYDGPMALGQGGMTTANLEAARA